MWMWSDYLSYLQCRCKTPKGQERTCALLPPSVLTFAEREAFQWVRLEGIHKVCGPCELSSSIGAVQHDLRRVVAVVVDADRGRLPA